MNRNERKLALQKEIDDRSKSLKKTAEGYKSFGKDALLIGGVLVLGYTLFQIFSNEDDEEGEVTGENKKDSILTSTLKATASSVLLALAKDKLEDYLSQDSPANE